MSLFKKKQDVENKKWDHVCYYQPINEYLSELLCLYNDDGTKDYKTVKVTKSNYDSSHNAIVECLIKIDKEHV